MGFIRTVLIIIVSFYVIGYIGRVLVPFLIKRQVRKFQKQQNQNFYNNKKEGEVTVTGTKNKSNKIIDDNDTEYVDFEEVE